MAGVVRRWLHICSAVLTMTYVHGRMTTVHDSVIIMHHRQPLH